MPTPSTSTSPSTATSRALVTTAHGGLEVVQVHDRPIEAPGPGQARVAIRAAAFNHLDLWVRRGIPAGHWPVPIVPCADGAGVIEALGPGVRDDRDRGGLGVGSEVVLYPVRGCGSCRACRRGEPMLCRAFGMLGENEDGCAREHMNVPISTLLPKPTRLSWVQAAALPTTMLTAWHMLATVAKVQPGETVVVLGARSGVGSAGVQIARLLGAQVAAVVRRDEDVEAAIALGAHHVLRSDDPGWSRQARALADGGVDVVFEHVGGAVFSDALRTLRRGGRLVTCGATAGHEIALDLRKVFFHSIAVLGSTMGTIAELEVVLTLAGHGQLQPVVGAVFPLEQGRDAMAALEGRDVFGKVVLSME